ncbi:leucine-rich repeat domain-containing protein [Microscilla marina]|nr:hypothetical protein [Microscilla marina]
MIIEANYISKIEKLLNSDDEVNHVIAFQIMSEMGAPIDLYPIMTNQTSKMQLCMQYGFRNVIAKRRVYMPDEFVLTTICIELSLPYGTPLRYQDLWRLEKLQIPEYPLRNHFTFGLEDDATCLDGLQFATQLKELSIVNHEMDKSELTVLQHLTNLEILKLKGISLEVFRMKNIQNWKPIGHLLQLKELHLVDCQLEDLAFLPKSMSQLEHLNLQHNHITNLIGLIDNPAIQYCQLDVRNNPLNANDLPWQLECLKMRKVEVLY